MRQRKTAVLNLIIFLFTFLLITSAYAAEPGPPVIDTLFDSESEAEIDELTAVPVHDAFEKLKHVKYIIDENLIDKAVFKAYGHRRSDALRIAEENLGLPVLDLVNNKPVTRVADFYVTKKILEAFPAESFELLNRLYRSGDATTRGNAVRASGHISGKATGNLLLEALDDKTPIQEKYVEEEGAPMRVCDMAYNQLVLRYRVRNVLRTIGTVYEIEDRDYHIGILKELIKKNKAN